jgi:hypothetical protein
VALLAAHVDGDGEARVPNIHERKVMLKELKKLACYPPLWRSIVNPDHSVAKQQKAKGKPLEYLLRFCRNIVNPDFVTATKRKAKENYQKAKRNNTQRHRNDVARSAKTSAITRAKTKEKLAQRRIKASTIEEGAPMSKELVERLSILWVQQWFTSPNVELNEKDIRLACIGMKNFTSTRCAENYPLCEGWWGNGSVASNEANHPLNIFSLSKHREGSAPDPPLTAPIPYLSLADLLFFSLQTAETLSTTS